MSEGWGDFSALLLIARDGDNLTARTRWASTRRRASRPTRRTSASAARRTARITRSTTLSFRHMADGAPLPTTHPFHGVRQQRRGPQRRRGLGVDAVGGLRRAPAGGHVVRRRRALKMRKYVVAGLLMAPPDATPTETRDAILTAAQRARAPPITTSARGAFARRGFGSCAVVAAAHEHDASSASSRATIVKGKRRARRADDGDRHDCDARRRARCRRDRERDVPVANTGHTALGERRR